MSDKRAKPSPRNGNRLPIGAHRANTSTHDFHIHGDNIVECERALQLFEQALGNRLSSTEGPLGSPVCPRFHLHIDGTDYPLKFTLLPGFGRWDHDILELIRDRGGLLREAPDVILTTVSRDTEEPVLAIEYCGALPAGNQAWQRNGRAYSFGLARVPYLYVAELGGYELDADRNRIGPRLPNPAVPFSYLAFSEEQDTPVLPVFLPSPGADEGARVEYRDIFAQDELLILTEAILLRDDTHSALSTLRRKVLSFVTKRASSATHTRTLTPEEWSGAYDAIESGTPLGEYLLTIRRLPWSKTAYIKDLTSTAKTLMGKAAEYAIGLTSTQLPMCLVPGPDRPAFTKAVQRIYPDLPDEFRDWLRREEELAICWVMGFKPRGDDARPDRGLPPLTRMLIGREHDLLTVVYGPAPEATWPQLVSDPQALASQNGLWEAILAVSDGLLIDAATDDVTNHGFIQSHWESARTKPKANSILVTPEPLRLGENDVDTVLHTLLARHAGDAVFEGMCNPPGGDWSGLSLQPENRSVELRWLTLPRISGAGTKRPDHVFQFFGLADDPIVLAVESKETAKSVERRIGPKLIKYVSNLISSTASVEREDPSDGWIHSKRTLARDSLNFASAVAFIPSSSRDMVRVADRSTADLILGFVFEANGTACKIEVKTMTDLGRLISDYLMELELEHTAIRLSH